MSKFNELVTKLREVFQIDRPELDFGVYRILNARADEINEYLEKRLKEKVEQALASGNAANIDQLKDDLKKAEQAATDAGFDPAKSPKVKELNAKIIQASSGNAEHENAVFSHLLTFFSRYYDNGDFISQRRYKGDTYAIPYAGEEVILHWANKDQYYIKSGENFSNYSFKLDDGRVVHFRLVAADTAKDNRKDNDKERRFVLAEHQIITRIDDEGDEYDDEILPVEEVVKTDAEGNETKELIIRFEYKAMPKGSKQDKLVEAAVNAVFADGAVASRWLDLSKREPTEKNPKRSLLDKHLTNYTTKNTADYFIHKNLGKFLRGELDFYIKNEVMHLDDVQNAEAFSDIEKNLRMIQCLRSIALDLIKFLAQLEDFQKKLWTKKKFVVSSDYFISLEYIPEIYYEEIACVEEQWIQWNRFGFITEKSDRTFLIENTKLPVDTRILPQSLKMKILSSIHEIDSKLQGQLISSDNYQALNFMENKYCGALDCIYIDPPYNTSENAFLYKNSYKHSSWNSLISNTTPLAHSLMSDSAVIMAAIDDTEYSSFKEILKVQFGEDNYVGTIAIEVNPAGQNIRPNVPARSHDYCHIFAKNVEQISLLERSLTEDERKQYKETDEQGKFYWDNLRRRGGNSRPSDRPKQWYPIWVNSAALRVPDMKWDEGKQKWIVNEVIKPHEIEMWPIDPKGINRIWRTNPDGARKGIQKNEIGVIEKAGRFEVSKKSYEPEGKKPKTLWSESKYSATSHGSKHLINLFGEGGSFSYPKSIHLVKDSLANWLNREAVVLDYFAGSGTTAEAAIQLNSEDGGTRKFILVEQGVYFDSVTLPRVVKVSYCSTWKNGKPSNTEKSSIFIKYLKLESYEDALNNLELKRPKVDLFDNNPELKDDYLLNYMLDVESRGSLLSTDDFRKPFDYTMKIALDSAGAFEEQKVDLVETFNYLIGLTVNHIDAQPERGFVTVTGILPSGETCLVLWRDCEKIDYEGLNKLCDKLALNPADNEFDVVYINGDHNIPTVLTRTAEEGGGTRVLKLRQIEPEFLERMFAVEDV